MDEKDKFDWAGNNFECWVNSAEGLLISGKVLDLAAEQSEKADPQNGWKLGMYSSSPKFLLFGYSLECFFKAVWLLRDKKNKLAENGSYVGPTSHKLNDLAKNAGFAFTHEEETVLERLSKIVVSTGRYPIATHWTVTAKKTILNVTGQPTWWQIGKDDERFEGILKKIREEIEKLKPQPKP